MTEAELSRWEGEIALMIERLLEDSPGLTPRTISDYTSTIRSLLRKMEAHGLPTDPKEIGPRDLNAVYSVFQEEGWAVSTQKTYVNVLKLYCSSAGNFSIARRRSCRGAPTTARTPTG